MTTLAYSILARGQSDTAYGIAVDLTSTFDPDYASQCGVRLDRLFLVRPDTEPIALDIARELLIINQAHLRRVMGEFVAYHNSARPH